MRSLKKAHLVMLMACAGLMACSSSEKKENRKDDPAQQDQQTEAQTGQQTDQTGAKTGQQPYGDLDIGKLSEALGHFIGRNLKSPGIQFNLEKIIEGMRNGAAGQPPPMTDEDYEAAMTKLQQKVFANLSETNLAAADKFLSENAHAQGIVEIVPGKLQYMILEEGHGSVVPEHGTPSIKYTGKFIDGTVFGSSDNSGGAITVPIDQTIQGFSKGIVGMKEGEKRRLFVHPDLGYGKGGQVPPNSLLIFDIELVKAHATDADSDEHDAEDESDQHVRHHTEDHEQDHAEEHEEQQHK